MKANEAPEKIYIPNELMSEEWQRHIEGEDIEYIRADAFIEKTCEWLKTSLEDTKVLDDYRDIMVRGIQASYTTVDEFIEDFKKAIEVTKDNNPYASN